jgi:hypothetical protein
LRGESAAGGGGSMVVAVLLIAGIGFLLAGLLAIGFGIPVKEFSFGNTLILTGAVVACTGAMLLGLWVLVRELKNFALGSGMSLEPRPRNRLPSAASSAPGLQAPEDGGFLFGGDQPAPDNAGQAGPGSAPPWQAEVATRDRVRADTPPASEPAEAQPPVKPRRNLLFSSSSRKERERAQARTPDPSVDDLPPAAPAAPPPPETSEAPPVTFDDAWPKSERSRTPDAPPRRSGRTPSTFTEASAGTAAPDRTPPAPRHEELPPVTVLKSGVVDGMAYSLYSDGSIEAQMPEGMMRFASIDELRSHLDQRP